MMKFKDKTLLITGGTGSFGNAVIQKFIDSDIQEIRIFSRDEKKQDDLRKRYNSEKLKFYIGDVRDEASVSTATKNVNYIFHAAALKQVPSCEFYPLEALKTNIIGTSNLIESAIKNNVEKVICLSTDKAVYPINAMGMTKGLMEKVAIAASRNTSKTIICTTRYGNVMGSRGSVIPLFVSQIKDNIPITITDPKMTRFMMTLEDAIDLVIFAFEKGRSGDIFVQKSPGASIDILVKSIMNNLGVNDHKINFIGTRHGEKLYETLCSKEEMMVAEDLGNYFRIPSDSRDLNYEKYFTKGSKEIEMHEEYNSHNTDQLNEAELSELLKTAKIKGLF